MDQDAADVERVLAGDPEAFEPLVRRWQGPLLQLALRFCRDRGRAEDMVQEALLKVYRSLGQWRGESTLSTWLVAVATNAFRSHLRRRGGEPAVPEPADRASEPEDESGEPLRERVRRAVTALPARYRDAIVLYYFHGLDVRAAAASLGCPEGTLKARLARGRRLLEPLLRAAAAMEDS